MHPVPLAVAVLADPLIPEQPVRVHLLHPVLAVPNLGEPILERPAQPTPAALHPPSNLPEPTRHQTGELPPKRRQDTVSRRHVHLYVCGYWLVLV